MDPVYKPEVIEPEAQAYWDEHESFRATEEPGREKFYCLSMLPYPSGALHMGHVRNYTIGDVISRYQRMRGYNVLQPMGWDAFGLPAENAAIKHGVPPAKWTYANIAAMRAQLRQLGFGYDWQRELTTCRPEYYRWEQLFFTRLLRKGLVYRKDALVNWDPVDETVLANEQVIDGRGWRSGALVEKREIPQWFLKITDYAEELLADLERLDGWPEAVKTMQRNWIGRSEGLEIDFVIEGQAEPIRVFTTRPDTLLGVTYLAVAAEHPLALAYAEEDRALAAFVAECRRGGVSEAELETQEKRGMPLGVAALHPLTGEPVPVWVANFVLMGYGTGAVMAVPAHDQRDWEFATEYGLPIRQVIAPADGSAVDLGAGAFVDPGVLVNSGAFDGLGSAQAFDELGEEFARRGNGRRRVNFRLRDWGVSRQRYWGCPIPVVYCEHCGVVPVPEDRLPVILPEDVDFVGMGSPLKSDRDWRETECPECGRVAERETDTFDTFVESSWYYARYCCPDAAEVLDERADYWLPIDQYIGGIEHAVMHLLYFRFWHKLMRDAGLVASDEPAARLLCQGMVLAESYYRDSPAQGRQWIAPAEVRSERDAKGQVTSVVWERDGTPVVPAGWTTMSKSRNNGVNPQTLVDRYGADTVRLYSMFAAPPEQSLEWSDEGVEGSYRFLKRLWRSVAQHLERGPAHPADPAELDDTQRAMRRKVHETIAKVGDDIGRRYTFNTAIAAVMELSNALNKFDDDSAQGRGVTQEGLEAVVLMLAPITPHICHALWTALGKEGAAVEASWPEAEAAALTREAVDVVVQVNGRLRGRVRVPVGSPRETLEAAAMSEPNVQRFVAGKELRKVIVVPDKLVNLVVAG